MEREEDKIEEYPKTVQKVIVMVASAGGIDALTHVLSGLPAELPAAILIVQHLQPHRRTRLPEHLDRLSPLRVCLAQDGMRLEAGKVYVAVPGVHLRVEKGHLVQDLTAPVNYVRPSADVLFASVVQTFGADVIGVVLSGTGRDGTRGCQKIKRRGGKTIAQDEKTSHYFGMPGAAIEADAIDHVLPLSRIAVKIVSLIQPKK